MFPACLCALDFLVFLLSAGVVATPLDLAHLCFSLVLFSPPQDDS
jgi:hypothetical protein